MKKIVEVLFSGLINLLDLYDEFREWLRQRTLVRILNAVVNCLAESAAEFFRRSWRRLVISMAGRKNCRADLNCYRLARRDKLSRRLKRIGKRFATL